MAPGARGRGRGLFAAVLVFARGKWPGTLAGWVKFAYRTGIFTSSPHRGIPMTRAAKAGMARYFPSLRSSREERIALTPTRIRIALLAGLPVALALVPEAIAFAFVAGVAPLVGLYAAFFVGFITSIRGGRSGMISGATGAMAGAIPSPLGEGQGEGEIPMMAG